MAIQLPYTGVTTNETIPAPYTNGNEPIDLTLKEDKANKGVANGYAPLDANAKVPSSSLANPLVLPLGGSIDTRNLIGEEPPVLGGSINTSAGFSNGDPFNGGSINTSSGGSINTSLEGGSINTSGDGNGNNGGSINTSAGGGGPGGSINTSNGGGSINTSGGYDNGGGSINLTGGESGNGGSINSYDNGGSINLSYNGGSIISNGNNEAVGGSIDLSYGGGSINTSNGGGSINTCGGGKISTYGSNISKFTLTFSSASSMSGVYVWDGVKYLQYSGATVASAYFENGYLVFVSTAGGDPVFITDLENIDNPGVWQIGANYTGTPPPTAVAITVGNSSYGGYNWGTPAGGYIDTSAGGGSISTRGTGSIQLGFTATSQANTGRTTLIGSPAPQSYMGTDKTITLPNATGTLVLASQAIAFAIALG